jgi:hypothetical protein
MPGLGAKLKCTGTTPISLSLSLSSSSDSVSRELERDVVKSPLEGLGDNERWRCWRTILEFAAVAPPFTLVAVAAGARGFADEDEGY